MKKNVLLSLTDIPVGKKHNEWCLYRYDLRSLSSVRHLLPYGTGYIYIYIKNEE